MKDKTLFSVYFQISFLSLAPSSEESAPRRKITGATHAEEELTDKTNTIQHKSQHNGVLYSDKSVLIPVFIIMQIMFIIFIMF